MDKKREICVGTTCCRTLEAASNDSGLIEPGSTLLMLVSAFVGYELTMEAYRKAELDRYRFFSYGDAMLIL